MPPLRKRDPAAKSANGGEMIEVRDLSPAPLQPPQHAYSPVEDYRPQTMESTHSDYRPSIRSRDFSSGNYSRPSVIDGKDDYHYYDHHYSSSTLALDSPHYHNGNMPSGHAPKFAPRPGSYTDSPAGTRSSSPYPGASPYVSQAQHMTPGASLTSL